MEHQVICAKPKFILHPNIAELICKYHCYYLNGVRCFYKYKYRAFFHLDKKEFVQYLPLITHETSKDYFVVDQDSGQTWPIFLEVPCGKCPVCIERKAQAFVARCRYESLSYDCYPWFTTLTYDPKFLPEGGSVSVRDCQLFLKRLRSNLLRHGYFYPIRYCLVSEYGKHGTHRPHYHLVIWNLKPQVTCDYLNLHRIIKESWGLGFIQKPRIVDPSNDMCFYYTTKYMHKECIVPSGCNSTFMLTSRRHGGIGAAFLDSIADDFRRCCKPNFEYYDKFKNHTSPLILSSYVLNRLLPSFCSSVSSAFRSAVRDLCYLYKEVDYRCTDLKWLYEDIYRKTIESFRGQFYFGAVDGVEHFPSSLTDGQLFSRLNECRRIIDRFIQRPVSFDDARRLDAKRQLFLGRLSLQCREVDISQRLYVANYRQSRVQSTTIL